MVVEQSAIGMSSAYKHTQQYEKTEELVVTQDEGGNTGNVRPSSDSVAISKQAIDAMNSNANAAKSDPQADPDGEDALLSGDIKTLIIKLILEKLTGRKIDLKSIKGIIDAQNVKIQDNVSSPQQNMSISYKSSETYTERQSMDFSAAGAIKTADGKTIDFSVDLSLSSEFIQQNNIDLEAFKGKKRDPLVVNFAGTAAGLTGPTVAFDLSGDGHAENIHFVGKGSGFLALDANGDGKINDGNELFGPSTGNGFAELSQFDADQNGWIDENDPAYDSLSVWSKDSSGKDRLSSLKALGIGALDVTGLSTNFDYKDKTNRLQGLLKSTGIFLKENGTAGTIQQIDLVT